MASIILRPQDDFTVNGSQGLWLTTPNSLDVTSDINELFALQSTWGDVTKNLTTLKFYASEVSILGTSKFIQLMLMASNLNGTGIPLVTELGVLPSSTTGAGLGIEGFNLTFINI